MTNRGSFLDSEQFKLGEVKWGSDDCGDFWSAAFMNRQTGKQEGVTGNYYDVMEDGKRPPKEDQEAEIMGFAASK